MKHKKIILNKKIKFAVIGLQKLENEIFFLFWWFIVNHREVFHVFLFNVVLLNAYLQVTTNHIYVLLEFF